MTHCIISSYKDKVDKTTVAYQRIEDLAFTHWQYNANKKAYAAKLITKTMYEYAREELRVKINELEKLCYVAL